MRINLRNLVTVPSYGTCPASCIDVPCEEAIRFDKLLSTEERSLFVCGFLSWDKSKCLSAVEAQVNVGVLSDDAARRVLDEVSHRCEAMVEEDMRAMEAMSNPLGVVVSDGPEKEDEPERETIKAKRCGGRPRKSVTQ